MRRRCDFGACMRARALSLNCPLSLGGMLYAAAKMLFNFHSHRSHASPEFIFFRLFSLSLFSSLSSAIVDDVVVIVIIILLFFAILDSGDIYRNALDFFDAQFFSLLCAGVRLPFSRIHFPTLTTNVPTVRHVRCISIRFDHWNQ